MVSAWALYGGARGSGEEEGSLRSHLYSGAASWALVHLASTVVAQALCTWCSWPVRGIFTVVIVDQARRRAPCGRVCDSGTASWALVHLASTVVARALCTWCSWPVRGIQVRRRGLWWI
jgi:hypothetical protein